MNDKLKPMPSFRSDDEAERFVADADLSEYDLSGFVPMHFELQNKTATLTMRLPASLLEAVKSRAADQGIPYTRYLRGLMERDVERSRQSDRS